MDIKIKRANFINKVNELIQEFYFAHPKTIAHINAIQNSHFYGSVLWKVGSRPVEMLEKSWNVAIRRMFSLPVNTHRYLIEPISCMDHAITLIYRRFLSFIQSIRSSKKLCLRELLKVVEYDTRSVTGHNLRTLMLRENVHDIKGLRSEHVSRCYKEVPSNEEYRIAFIKELIEVRNDAVEVEGFDAEELEEILSYLCVS